MSIKDLKKQLVVFGYLPEVLPPFFTTTKLYKHYSELIGKIKRHEKGNYDCTDFTIHKSNESRRLLKFPNPIRQLLLIEEILENGNRLEKKFSDNISSLSNPFYYTSQEYNELPVFDLPKFRDDKTSKVKSTFLQNLQRKMDKSLGYRYCLKIDVANFYDSIYTHTIEWGFIGRKKAKRNSKDFNLGKKLDQLVSRTNSKETAGIPTGPFTSRIISELILVTIDRDLERLAKENNEIFTFIHYVDDYEFYFRKESDVYRMKNKIIEVFMFYKLRINDNKTKIEIYPYHSLIDIKKEYDFYLKKYQETKDKRYLRLLFFKSDELTNQGVKGAYKYLYKVLESKDKVDLADHWEIIEPFIIGHLLIQPSLGQHIANVILLYKNKVTKSFLEEIFMNLKLNMQNHLHNEGHWLLWVLLKMEYNFKEEELLDLYSECTDDFSKVMIIHTIYTKSLESSPNIKEVLEKEIQELEESSFEEDSWFLINEWFINRWINYKKLQSFYNGCEFYQVMSKHKISFIS